MSATLKLSSRDWAIGDPLFIEPDQTLTEPDENCLTDQLQAGIKKHVLWVNNNPYADRWERPNSEEDRFLIPFKSFSKDLVATVAGHIDTLLQSAQISRQDRRLWFLRSAATGSTDGELQGFTDRSVQEVISGIDNPGAFHLNLANSPTSFDISQKMAFVNYPRPLPDTLNHAMTQFLADVYTSLHPKKAEINSSDPVLAQFL